MVEANQNRGYEAVEIHFKRIETSRNAWLGQAARAQQQIQYHGNIVCKSQSQAAIDASWEEIARQNKRQNLAERRIAELNKEEQDLRDLVAVSKAREFMRNINEIQSVDN